MRRSARRRSASGRRVLPLLIVLVCAAAGAAVAAAPAHAFDEWIHGGIGSLSESQQKAKCNSSGCHTDGTRTNASCVQSGCHTGYTTSGGAPCWDCHEPGSAPSVDCAGTCHRFSGSGSDFSYSVSFSHGATPHLGASGYGKTCAGCHGGGAHHDAAAAAAPTCAQCHDGALAKSPPASHNDGGHTTCEAAGCHVGMSVPAGGDCKSCHVGNPSSGGPQITYSNDLTCADAGCHAKVKNHVGTPIASAACVTCHTAHYESLGVCTKCHPSPETFHHGTAAAVPLAQCATCHDGGIAKAPSAHQVYSTACATCHTGMDKPSGDCAACHVGKPSTGASQITYTNDLACADAGCHGKVRNHVGTLIDQAACTTCHEPPHYAALGTCTKCHPDPKTFHHGTSRAIPLAQCATCHNGGIAAAPGGHSSYGTDCAGCHNGMDKPSGDCASCHVGNQSSGAPQITYSNTYSCADAACHAKVKNHAGTPIASAACTTCHTAHYEALGTCTKCHPSPETFHHATATPIPLAQCARCHDGGIAAAPTGHSAYGTDCASCHNGMDKPSGDCAACHVGKPGSGAPQITYSNDLTCADAGCHAKVKNHVGTPIAQAACTQCHAAHYATLGDCATCHAGAESYHHATAQSIPLAQCARCHDGGIAAAPAAHAQYGATCADCHDGMDKPDADCAACHGKPQGSLAAVTSTNPRGCADASCHGKIKNHAGTPITAACATCHKTHFETLGECVTCHTEPVRFHHGTTKAIALDDCATCHDGGIAAAPAAHDGYSKTCADCHKGMDIPSGSCMECHSKAQGKVPAVKYTNTLSCGDVQCHGKIRNHKGTSIAAAACTTCHKAHYETLGTCATCHEDAQSFHHGTSEAVALEECQVCHDSRQSHAGVRCDTCHDSMAPAPTPSACLTCHDKLQVGSATCTACHSKSSGMFGDKELIHAKEPKVTCSTCHKKPHYTDLGGCDSCHGSHVQTHHAQATLADTTLRFAVSHRKVKKGARVRVGGSLSGAAGPLAGQKVLLQARTSAKKRFKTVSTLTTREDGSFGRTLKVRKSTKYRVVWRAEGDLGLLQRPAVKLAAVKVRK